MYEGPTGTPVEVLSCPSLREAKISKDGRPTNITQLAVPASQTWSQSYLYPPNIVYPPQALPQHWPCLSMCIQSSLVLGSGNKLQYTTRRFLVYFSPWSPDKCSSTTPCNVHQSMPVASNESFITCPFTFLL